MLTVINRNHGSAPGAKSSVAVNFSDEGQLNDWKAFAVGYAKFIGNEWLQQLQAIFSKKNPADVMIIRYEELFDEEKLPELVVKLLKMVSSAE
jgi:uncharacterized membrane protein YheB (UPF0754 family)